MRKVFAALASLLTLAVVAQFYLAATGAFDTAPKHESFGMHRGLGYGILLFAVVLTVLAALARLPGRLTGMTGLVAGLVLLQGVISALASAFGDDGGSTAGPVVFGLHAVNGLAIMAVAGVIALQARELSRQAAPEPAHPAHPAA